MRLAFLTGALAAGVAGALLAVGLVWVITLLTGSSDAWAAAAVVVPVAAALLAVATYVAERVAYRTEMARRRAIGEPWAYRE